MASPVDRTIPAFRGLRSLGIHSGEYVTRDGILTDAVVVRCESRREDGKTRYYPYVRYKAYDGREYEARINVRTNFPIGRKIKIKYIPQKYDYVAFVSQEIGSECQ